MSTKAQRGTKRTCQNPECGSRFYDLSRNPIVCPICGESYELPSSGGVVPPVEDESKKLRKAPVAAAAAGEPAEADADADDALVSLEEADEEIAGDGDETFLEEEEEGGGDVTGIVGGVAEGKLPVAVEAEAMSHRMCKDSRLARLSYRP